MVKDISVEELARWRAEGRTFVLLDVREPMEISLASIDGATLVPMRQIPQRQAELPKDRPIAVLCHSGNRSQRVAAFLLSQGFTEVVNVEGGIDAYARLVDSSIGRY
jgi:rhodanese-related sulfurtransferase